MTDMIAIWPAEASHWLGITPAAHKAVRRVNRHKTSWKRLFIVMGDRLVGVVYTRKTTVFTLFNNNGLEVDVSKLQRKRNRLIPKHGKDGPAIYKLPAERAIVLDLELELLGSNGNETWPL